MTANSTVIPSLYKMCTSNLSLFIVIHYMHSNIISSARTTVKGKLRPYDNHVCYTHNATCTAGYIVLVEAKQPQDVSLKQRQRAGPPCLLSTLLNPSIFNLQPLQQTQDTVRYRLNQLTVDSIQESQLCFLKKLKKTQHAESTVPKNVPAVHRKKSSETAVTNYIV